MLGAPPVAGFPQIWRQNASLVRAAERQTEAAERQIKAGVHFSLTGAAAIEQSLHQGTILATKDINAAGGINGKEIAPVVEDPPSVPAPIADKARNLAPSNKCVSDPAPSLAQRQWSRVFERRRLHPRCASRRSPLSTEGVSPLAP